MKKILLSALLLAAGWTVANAQSLELYIGTEYKVEKVLGEDGKPELNQDGSEKTTKTVTDYRLIKDGDVINTSCHKEYDENYGTTSLASKAYVWLKNKSDLPLKVKIVTAVDNETLSPQAQQLMNDFQGGYQFCIFNACMMSRVDREGTIPAYGETPGGTGEDMAYSFTFDPEFYPDMELSQITYDAKNTYTVTTDEGETLHFSVTFNSSKLSGIDGIEADNAEAEYYNLQGIRVSNPEKGQLYIVRKGAKTSKVIF